VATSFGDTARAAQISFDEETDLAQVPFERVVELAPSLRRPRPLFSQINFFDAQAGPFSMLTKMFEGLNMGAYSDGRFTYPLSTIVGRFDETTVSVLFPNNPVARESITQYVAALKSVCVRVADGWTPSRVRDAAELSEQPAY
jgi:2'-acyl-2-O-sulfo-trehalose (hydroxy)phthioceranyltransferase